MSRNLRDKIRLIVRDAYDLRQESVVTQIENLIKEELGLREEERAINYQDLTYINSVAAQELTQMRVDQEAIGKVHGDQPMLRTLCIVNATVGFLRQRGLMTALVKYKK